VVYFMKLRVPLIAILIPSALVTTALAVLLAMANFDTTLQFVFEDSVSGGWVWGAVARLQDRALLGFYQSDAGPVPYTFTHLKPGDATLTIEARGYEPVSVPVTLRRGSNRLRTPIRMVGTEIPSLVGFAIFENRSGADVVCELRPVGEDGSAVVNHPCLAIWIGCRVTTQLRNGVPIQEPVDTGSSRGEELFRGKLEWTWDPLPQTVFRYTARIPGARIAASAAPYRVVDYLVVVPDPRAIGPDELNALMNAAPSIADPDALRAYLERQKGRLTFFFDTSWNVAGGAP
jgi:hypothetical protein